MGDGEGSMTEGEGSITGGEGEGPREDEGREGLVEGGD
jgi:hypothetical protein